MARPAAAVALVLGLLQPVSPARAAAEKPVPLAPGHALPRLTGRMLSGRDGTLPDRARGKVTLIMLGFSYQSRHAVGAWAERYRARFGADTMVTLYEVPMIGGMARLGAPFIESGMRRGTPGELHEHVIVVYGDTRPWRTRVGYTPEARDDAYLVLVDHAGLVRWLGHGPWDESLAANLFAAVERLTPVTQGATP